MTSIASLVAALGRVTVSGPTEGETTAVCQDSREVRPGATFVAVPGARVDGHTFLPQAVAAGARVLVVQQDRAAPAGDLPVTVVRVPDTRQALGTLAAAFYGFPARRLKVVGITGTDGKTTTTFLTSAVLAAGGIPTAFLSTAGSKIAEVLIPNDTHLTTPDAVAVQRFLARARDAGAECAIVEATSQGLDQGRLAELEPDVAVLTNLSVDHLDYHDTKDAYLLAKARLFDMLDASYRKGLDKAAVLNADSPASTVLATRTGARHVSYGITTTGDHQVRADQVRCGGWRTSYVLRTGTDSVDVHLGLPGRFNVSNSLAAAAVGVAFGLDLSAIRRGLAAVTQVPGRMQRIEAGQPFPVVVDYAHNPHELWQVLSFLRGTVAGGGRVIAVFGCAGDRDPGRRRQMGRVAARLADYPVVTSENTGTESREAIAAEVVRGLVESGRRPDRDCAVRLDRREAIRLALSQARDGDVVLVAGMGHEQSMIVGGHAVEWDDRLVIHELLGSLAPAGRG